MVPKKVRHAGMQEIAVARIGMASCNETVLKVTQPKFRGAGSHEPPRHADNSWKWRMCFQSEMNFQWWIDPRAGL